MATATPNATSTRRMIRSDLVTLRQIAIFRNLEDRVLERLAEIGEVVLVPEGSSLCKQGEHANQLHILLEGQVALSNTAPNGTSAVVEVVPPGGHFVLATVLANLPYLLNASAISAARLIIFPAPDLRRMIQELPTLATAFMVAEAQDFRNLVRQVCDLKLRTTAQRLGCYLLSLSKEPAGNTASLRLPFDKRLLAARLGCRQENLSRAFASLRTFGVETHGSRVILHDISSLRHYAEPDDFEQAEFA